jgi:hypothetical protein
MGKALLAAAEEDVRRLGAKGLAAWGNTYPGWMPVAWLLKLGYTEADRRGPEVLVWKSFGRDAIRPQWRVPRKSPPTAPDTVTVTVFLNPWCGIPCDFYETVRDVVGRYPSGVQMQTVDTTEASALDDWGYCNAVFVDGQQVTRGVEELQRTIDAQLLRHRGQRIGGER